MGVLKPNGRTVRIDESMLPLLERLRALMLNTAHSSGLKINRADVPSDGVVVGFALTMTEILMDPKFALIDREQFLGTLDREVAQRVPEFAARTPEDRRAFIDLLMASCCEFTAYDPDSPLNAMAPEGGKPS